MAEIKKKESAGGRPTSYKQEYAEQAYKLCLLGATDTKLADFFGVSESTLNLWKQAHPKFSESMSSGKDQADAEIAQALFHRAKGYSHPEVDVRVVASEIVQTPLTKHYPPDTQAASLWLRNRQPRLWRDKVDMELTGRDGGPLETVTRIELVAPSLNGSDSKA
jgi:hypothetical protein